MVVRGEARFFDDLGDGTNTDAEWLALIKAAEAACELGDCAVELRGDALAVIEQANGKVPSRGESTRALHRQYLQLAAERPGIRLRWLRRNQNLAGIALAARCQQN